MGRVARSSPQSRVSQSRKRVELFTGLDAIGGRLDADVRPADGVCVWCALRLTGVSNKNVGACSLRPRLTATIAAVLTLAAAPVLADMNSGPCADALGKVQGLLGKTQDQLYALDLDDLSTAASQLRICSDPSCPAPIHDRCRALSEEVALARMPRGGCVPSAFPMSPKDRVPTTRSGPVSEGPPHGSPLEPVAGVRGDLIVFALLLFTGTFVGSVCVGAIWIYRRVGRTRASRGGRAPGIAAR
jgi:hypothetical protein